MGENIVNVNTIPRCVQCSKLFKKSEMNEKSLCPKCLSESADTATGDIGESAAPVEMMADNEPDNGKSAEAITVRPGALVRERFAKMVDDGLISEEILQLLMDKTSCAQAFSCRYAFLKQYDPTLSTKEQVMIKSNARYSARPITVRDQKYLITNDLYKKTAERFIQWADGIH